EAIAQVDHAGCTELFCQHSCKSDARLEGHVSSENAPAQRSAHADGVTNAGTAACHRLDAFAPAHDRDRDDQLACPRPRITADDWAIEDVAGLLHAKEEFLRVFIADALG